MSHILVAITTPMAGANLFAPLADLAGRFGASVTLLQAIQSRGARPAETLAAGRETTQHLLGRLTSAGVKAELRHVDPTEDVVGAILDAAEETSASLIFMGVSGKSAFARRTGGDLPATLLSRTTVPVLFIPPAAGEPL